MYLKEIEVQNFRSFGREFFEFTPLHNIIYGLNGTGKSNLLEAISYISNARSFRDVEDRHLIKWGESFFRLKGKLVGEKISYAIKILYLSESTNGHKRKEIQINGKPVKRMSDLSRLWPSVFLSSSDHQLLDGSPKIRRRYFDRLLSIVDPLYPSYLYRYKRSLEHKNALLKSGKSSPQLSYWNKKLEELGAYIIEKRIEWIEKTEKKMIMPFKSFSGRELGLRYAPSIMMKEGILDSHREEEIKEGYSLFGPHRDEIDFYLDGKKVRLAASEGEKRIIIFSWATALREILLEITGKEPTLILDDPLSVLGENNSRLLLDMCGGQVFISTVRRIPDIEPLIVLGEAVQG